jgi:capsular exopolysaccharide synthesis family protein
MQNREVHLRDYLRVINKRRSTVYTFFIIVFAVVLIGTFTVTPVYKAKTKLLIEKVEPSSLIKDYGYAQFDPEFYATQYQLIKSTNVSRKVVEMLKPDKAFGSYFRGGSGGGAMVARWVRGAYAAALGVMGKAGSSSVAGDGEKHWMGVVAKVISKDVEVRHVKNSRIVEISYMSTSPELAKLVANTVVRAYMDAILDMRMSSSKYTLEWMTKKAEEERAKLRKSEDALQDYMQANDIVTLEDRLTIVPEKLSELSSQLIKSETRRKELEALYKKVRKLPRSLKGSESISAIASDPMVRSLRELILNAEQNISELSRKYGRKHHLMIMAEEDLKSLRQKKKQEIRRVIESIKNEYELALSNENGLRDFLDETKGEAMNLSERFIQYGVLKREVDTNRQLFDSLIKKMKEQSLTEEIQTVKIWVVEEAETPARPVKPNKKLNVLLGIFSGLLGGMGLAFFIEYLDNTIKSPEETEARLGVPVLGMVSLLRPEGKDVTEGIELIVLKEPRSAFTESYKALRTAVMLSSADSPPKSLLITSMGPGEGKTATSVNLALAVAQSDRRVLLVDADLRKPRIHKILGLPNRYGLSTYLAGDASRILSRGPIPKLDVITSGPIPPNPSELLSSERFKRLLASMGGEYDLVIFDSPPVLTVTDSLLLGRQVDGTIVVARAGKATYEIVEKGLKLLGDVKSHMLGMLINALEVTKGAYYYKYYNYSYADEEESIESPEK